MTGRTADVHRFAIDLRLEYSPHPHQCPQARTLPFKRHDQYRVSAAILIAALHIGRLSILALAIVCAVGAE
jgi:hypothetical protein